MLEPDDALRLYSDRVRTSTLTDYPIMYAMHFGPDSLLGALGVHELPEGDDAVGHVTFGLLLPFSMTHSIQYAYLVVDESAVTGRNWTKRRVIISRMLRLGDGVLTTHWAARMSIGDHRTVFGNPVKEPNHLPRVNEAISVLMDHRNSLDPGYTFDEAWAGAGATLDEIMS